MLELKVAEIGRAGRSHLVRLLNLYCVINLPDPVDGHTLEYFFLDR